jgi:quercetin dioxygenase-like cupin family protein
VNYRQSVLFIIEVLTAKSIINMDRRKFFTISLLSLPALIGSSAWRVSEMSGKAFVLRSGLSRFGVPTPFLGVNPNDLKLSSKDTLGKLSAFEYFGTQKTGPSLHAHLNQDEMFYVLEGRYIFQSDEEKQLLQAGDLIFLPRTIKHSWVQISDTGQMFYFLQPAGQMEEFFLKMSKLSGKESDTERKQIGIDAGIVNYGPPLSPTEKHIINDRLSNGFIIRSGESRFGEKTKLNNRNLNDIKVSGKDTGSELAIFEYNGNEKGGPPLHIHNSQDEIFYIAQGSYMFRCADEKFTLQKGDMIFLPRGVPHAFAQLTDNGKLLYFMQPSGKMEDYFRAMGNLKGNPSQNEAQKLFQDHDMQLAGPPLEF